MKLKPATMRKRPAPGAPVPRARKPRQAPVRKVKLEASVARSTRTDDDEFDEYEDEEPNMKFGQAFLIVLILHVVAVAGVLTFNSIKAKQIAPSDVTAQEEVVAETTTKVEETASTDAAASQPKTAATTTTTAQTGKPAPTAAASDRKVYKVLPGDTLTHISEKHGVSIAALEEVNDISSYSTIRVGQELVIPGNEPVTPSRPSEKVAAAKPPSKPAAEQASAPPVAKEESPASEVPPGGVYVVEKGDNPYSIARRFGVSYDDLMKANSIDDPTKLQIGEELTIPTGN